MRTHLDGAIRIGIIGSGRIAERFISEAQQVQGIEVVGVYNPRFPAAREFADRHHLEIAAESEEMLYKGVDAVYIASPHETHFYYIMNALVKGKHVWCEKPMVLDKQEAEKAFACAKHQGLVLMEAIKTAYCPGFLKVLEVLDSGRIGLIRDVEGTFTKLSPPGEHWRELSPSPWAGSFTELGSYPLMAVLSILGDQYESLRFEHIPGQHGLDLYTKAYFRYTDSLATVKVGLGVKSEGTLVVSGSKGYLKVVAPWWKTDAFSLYYEDATSRDDFEEEFAGEGLRYGLSWFAAAIQGSQEAVRLLPSKVSIGIAAIMAAFLKERNGGRRGVGRTNG
ncbi:Gfo/Idh/MocA family oxidoreductase [Paenibacillus spiritus]|uniref:Gfo/Idh/MocA family oxidoreductase n=1 Tax=Paenibacillus spiritus TaxID=2496557 RepID=A0A5J5FY43_9BACL|nr:MULTISPECIES: Gfo/Idh/MocA family oxidoreductase [Paenibacillus]KAA8997974.1 Gfo/Idh/MocA family oxidoreductase [Paenibacillus spiritus]